MEVTYQRALKALPLKNATFKIAEVQAPFSNPKLDTILHQITSLEGKLELLTQQQRDNGTNEETPNTTSYASTLRKPKSTLVVKSTKEDPKAVLTKLKRINCPEEVKITKVKVLPRKLEVRCSTENEKGTLHSYLQKHLPVETIVEEKRPQLLRLMALNVPDCVTEKQLHTALGTQEEQVAQTRTISKFRARRENAQHWVLLCPKRMAQTVLESGFINAGFNRIRIKKHVRMHSCRNCQNLNHHHTQECKSRAYCPKCAGNHTAAECRSNRQKCINCHSRNKMMEECPDTPAEEKIYLDTNHAADSSSCHTHQDVINERLCLLKRPLITRYYS